MRAETPPPRAVSPDISFTPLKPPPRHWRLVRVPVHPIARHSSYLRAELEGLWRSQMPPARKQDIQSKGDRAFGVTAASWARGLAARRLDRSDSARLRLSYIYLPAIDFDENDANNDDLQYRGSMDSLSSTATSRPPSPLLETFHSDSSGQSTPDMSQTSLRLIFPSQPSSIQHPDNAPSLTWKDLLATSYPAQWQLEDIIADHNSRPWKTVSELHPDQFQTVMDGLQLILDYSPHMDSASRTAAIKCLQAISALSGCLPTCMTIESVFTESHTPSFGGGFADVWFGQAGFQRVALKVLRTFGNDDDDDYIRTSEAFRQEALLWRQLRHPNILPFLGVNTMTFFPRPCLISPCMKHGNINQFLRRQPTHNRLQVIIEVMEGIQFLHSHETPLVHADIRGANILVQDDLTCCLADFGLTTVVDSRIASSRVNGGAARWLAPESLDFNESTGCQADHLPSRDIYAFGCTVIEICSGKAPFPNIRCDPAILTEVLFKKKKPLPSPTTFLTQAVWDVVDRCLAFEAMDRPDAPEVLRCLRGPLDRLIDQLDLDS